MSFSTGAAEAAELPDWVPLYPGCEPTGAYTMSSADGLNGGFQLETGDSVQEVLAFYQTALKELGLELQVSTFSGDSGSRGGMVRALNGALTVDVVERTPIAPAVGRGSSRPITTGRGPGCAR